MGKKILVIDDDQTGVALIRGRLSAVGYEIFSAPNGTGGLNLVKSGHPDLIILDVEMPEMNGYTFMVELKKLEQGRDIPVIVLTTHEENKAIFLRRGVQDFLVKPVHLDQLLDKIRALVG